MESQAKHPFKGLHYSTQKELMNKEEKIYFCTRKVQKC